MKSSLIRDYISLTKPGIIRGNLLVAAAGFLLASGKNIDTGRLLATCLGTSLIIASACTFNNYIDRKIDRKMKRTSKRPLADGRINLNHALFFASSLFVLGAVVLNWYVSALVFWIGLVGFVDYIFLYSYFKRRSTLSTLIGGISGATPPVAGYVAVTGELDTTALLLFLALAFWQMPHFFAIALFRESDYASADLPVHPRVKGHGNTKMQIIGYTIGFGLVVAVLGMQPDISQTFSVIMLLAVAAWIAYGLRGYKGETVRWAKGMFGISLIQLLLFSILLGANAYLP